MNVNQYKVYVGLGNQSPQDRQLALNYLVEYASVVDSGVTIYLGEGCEAGKDSEPAAVFEFIVKDTMIVPWGLRKFVAEAKQRLSQERVLVTLTMLRVLEEQDVQL